MFLVVALACFWVGLGGVIALECSGHTTLASVYGGVGWLVAFCLASWGGWLRWCIRKEQEK